MLLQIAKMQEGVIVITGDNKNTTETICRNIGVFDQNENLSSKSFLRRDFMKLSQVEQCALLFEIVHYQRGKDALKCLEVMHCDYL